MELIINTEHYPAGTEAQGINLWHINHPGKLVISVTPDTFGQKLMSLRIQQTKDEDNTKVVCQNIGLDPTRSLLDDWRHEHRLSGPDPRDEILLSTIPNNNNSGGMGFIICSKPFEPQTGVK
jgi:hypothetical protein